MYSLSVQTFVWKPSGHIIAVLLAYWDLYLLCLSGGSAGESRSEAGLPFHYSDTEHT